MDSSIKNKILDRKLSDYIFQDVVKVKENVTLPNACDLLKKRNIDEIIVVDDFDHPIGIVTDEDILDRVAEAQVNTKRTTVGDVMTIPVIGIYEEQNFADALKKMNENKIRKLVVLTEKNTISGIIYKKTILEQIRKSNVRRPKQSSLWGVIWNLGMILQFAGALLLVPGIVATIQQDNEVAASIFLMSVLLLISGFFMNSYGEKQAINARGLAILVFSGFMSLVLFGMIPQLYIIDFESNDFFELFSDAFHESAAGFTTGGLSIVTHPEDYPRSFTFYRAYTQFVGGLSFIYLIITAFYSESKLGKMKGFISGHTLHLKELFLTITIIFSIYVIMISAILSYLSPRHILDDLALTLSAVSTGGWIPDSEIFSSFTPPEYVIIIVAMILGALPFNFHYAFVRTKFLSPNITKEVTLYFIILTGLSIAFILSINVNPLDGIFNLVSASTTTGYATIGFEKISAIPFFIIVSAMLIGSCGFSTGGGLKVFRLITLWQLRYVFFKTSWQKIPTSSKNDIIVALIILSVSLLIPIFVASHLSAHGYDFQDSFFDAVSAITTVGLSTGVVNIGLDPFMKIVFGFLAILGRIEIILLVYMFVPKLMR